MSVKLQYFNFISIGEAIRYMLYYSEQEFEDIRYEPMDWPIKTITDSLPFGQLPVYQEGHRTLTQSYAIARYVAHKAGLIPSDIWEQAQLDSAALNIYDYFTKAILPLYEQNPEKKTEMIEKFITETVDFYFSRFEKQLEANNGHFGKKLSWVDFVLVAVVEATSVYYNADDFYQKYTNALALKKEITSLPGVKEYIVIRKSYG